jgi:hypothetical protein
MALYWKANGDTTKAWVGTLSDERFKQIKTLINKLDVTEISGSIGTIIKDAHWRIDRQSPTSTASNIQVQMNGVGNPSTVAGVLVPDILTAALGSTKGLDAEKRTRLLAKRKEALHYAVYGALIQSAATLADELSEKGKPNGKKCIKMQTVGGAFDI